ncbi:MAG: SusC/RagA family TonB-linked outer membrane protein [Chitinophagaceae bacterium]|nr:SusC/RagA family TonB-linked outer membrane protein [Chitinophagaceae bacterium]
MRPKFNYLKTFSAFLLALLVLQGQVFAADPSGRNSYSDHSLAVTVRGTVTDQGGTPLEGVSIKIKGTDKGTTSGPDGSFTIDNVEENAKLVISFVGYHQQEVDVAGKSRLSIILVEDRQALSEVVVTALGIKRESKALGYSVTKVDGSELTTNREANFGEALRGKVAGVNVTAMNSGLGGSSRMTIRGNTSISGDNQPLYVVNGVPINNSGFDRQGDAEPDWGDNISSINADDIEEISVLKGATAAALYGSRAKNGAVIITTKSGKGRKGIGVTFNSSTTVQVPHFIWELQKEYGQGYGNVRPQDQSFAAGHGQNHWGERYDGVPTVQFDGEKRPYSYVKDQVLKDFYRNGLNTTNNVSFSSGGKNGSFRLGVTDTKSHGIIPNSKLSRDNISLGVNQKIVDRLTVNAYFDYINENVDDRPVTNGGRGGDVSTILWINSNMPTSALAPGYLEDGSEKTLGTDLNATNPYFALNRIKNTSVKNRYIGSAQIKWDILDWLFVQGRVGQDQFVYRMDNILPEGTGFIKPGRITQRNTNFTERNWELMFGVNKELGSNFNLNVNAGGNIMTQHSEGNELAGDGVVIPGLEVINNTSTKTSYLYEINKRINSLFATAELSYKNYLYLNVTGRNDWYSSLHKDHNNYLYPSVSGSFVFSEVFNLPSFIDFGKFRTAYASVGGDTDPYQLALSYELLGFQYDGHPLGYITQENVPNSLMRPLSVGEFELGVDMRFFKNRLGIDMAYYNKLTKNDITKETLTTTSGYAGASVNVGKLRNRGFELLIYGTPVQTSAFSWDVSLNGSYNKSKVLKISDQSNYLNLGSRGKAAVRAIEGQEYAQIVGPTIERNAEGQDIISDQGLNIVNRGNLVSFGSGIHKWNAGITNTFNYKSFSLSFLIDGKFGAKLYSVSSYELDHRGMTVKSLLGRAEGTILPGVKQSDGKPNDIFVTPAMAGNRLIVINRREALDDYLYDGSFIKLRNISLTYNLPNSVLNSVRFINGASVSLIGSNLALLMTHAKHIDPDGNYTTGNAQGIEASNLPPIRSYGVNIKLKF